MGKRYYTGLSKSTVSKRKSQFKNQTDMSDRDPSAYKPAPGDLTKSGEYKQTKKSKHTEKYYRMYGEEVNYVDESAEASLRKKAEKSGISYGTLKKVYNRGMAAWKTGHRPGATQQQWAHARVNSYITKGKGTYHGADKDLREIEEGGLWANIHAKRKRIKHGSNERMRKPGEKGAPTPGAFKTAKESVELDEIMNPAMRRAKLIKRMLKPVHDSPKHFKTKETSEPQSTNSNDSSSRFDTTDSTVRIYKRDTPGQ